MGRRVRLPEESSAMPLSEQRGTGRMKRPGLFLSDCFQGRRFAVFRAPARYLAAVGRKVGYGGRQT